MHSLLSFFLAVLGSHQPFDYTDQVGTPDHGVRYISGVLGYTRSCDLAIYPDRLAAITRNQSTAFVLEPKSFSRKLDKGVQIGPLLHQYVYLTGRVESGSSGFGGTLSVASVYLPQYDSYTSGPKCVPFSGDPIDVSDAIVRASAKGVKEERTLVYGYVKIERDYFLGPSKSDAAKGVRDYQYVYTLYASREAYDDRVFSQSIIPAIASDLPIGCEGRLMLMEGRLVRLALNSAIYVNLRDVRVIEDTCAGKSK